MTSSICGSSWKWRRMWHGSHIMWHHSRDRGPRSVSRRGSSVNPILTALTHQSCLVWEHPVTSARIAYNNYWSSATNGFTVCLKLVSGPRKLKREGYTRQ